MIIKVIPILATCKEKMKYKKLKNITKNNINFCTE